MRSFTLVLFTLATIFLLTVSALSVSAAKPQDVIAKSNGFPSGPHFNLNIHGKDPLNFTPGDNTEGGSSVFISEYTFDPVTEDPVPETIRYSSDRKGADNLIVHDAYSEAFATEYDPIEVELPYEQEGYYVFARILGKPQNGQYNDERSNIILYPNNLISAQNYEDGDLLGLGLITRNATYYAGEEGFYRFDEPTEKGKGKSKARDITHLFSYSGWVIDPELDINNDGDIDINDLPSDADAKAAILAASKNWEDYDGHPIWGNNNGLIDTIEEWLAFNADLGDDSLAWYFANEWIFSIADLVITEQGLVNDGTKLIQIRFYPVATTSFTPKQQIIVNKVVSSGDTSIDFGFETTFGNFVLGDGQEKASGSLGVGTYSVTELIPGGWDQPNILVEDPTGDSTSSGATATIKLDPDETVIITFFNVESTT
jgi:hypothetical protein